ncbi:hypothetical protein ACGF3G_11860 [Streptomyces sp. NPDC048179]
MCTGRLPLVLRPATGVDGAVPDRTGPLTTGSLTIGSLITGSL